MRRIPYNEFDIGYTELGTPRIAAKMHGFGTAIEMLIGCYGDVDSPWNDVTPVTFRNCFGRAGLTIKPSQSASPDQVGSIDEMGEELANVPDVVLQGVPFEDCVSVDDNVKPFGRRHRHRCNGCWRCWRHRRGGGCREGMPPDA